MMKYLTILLLLPFGAQAQDSTRLYIECPQAFVDTMQGKNSKVTHDVFNARKTKNNKNVTAFRAGANFEPEFIQLGNKQQGKLTIIELTPSDFPADTVTND